MPSSPDLVGSTVPAATPSSSSSDELLLSLPTPVIRLLILFARPIHRLKRSIEILTWRSEKRAESWMVVGVWCAVCLCGSAVWVYLLPPLLLLPFIPLPSTPTLHPPSLPFHLNPPLLPPTPAPSSPATSQSVLLTLAQLHAIDGMLPNELVPRKWRKGVGKWREMEGRRVVRGGMILWALWVLANWIMGERVTLLLLGSAVLLSPSPQFRAFLQLVRKSLLIRRLATLAFLLVFGSPPGDVAGTAAGAKGLMAAGPTGGGDGPTTSIPTGRSRGHPGGPFSFAGWMHDKWTTSRRPSFAFRLRPKEGFGGSTALTGSAIAEEDESLESTSDERTKAPIPSPPIYFRFELQENQRWWMGLDWTSALLPQERPAWCDVYLSPASPPGSFGLPGESVWFLPEPREGDPNARTRRVARWRWIDEDWSVVKRLGEGKAISGGGGGGGGGSGGPGAGAGSVGSTSNTGNANPPSTTYSHVRSGSISSHTDDSAHAAHDDQPKSKGIAEQAFLKGMEKLKQRTLAGAGAAITGTSVSASGGSGTALGAAGLQGKGRPASGDFSDGGAGGAVGRETASHSRRRTSSGASDLTALLGGTGGGSNFAGGSGSGYNPNASAAAALALHDLDAGTDLDGWSYGDNKWEGMGPKGGMGRYTRRRRWQRRAVCTETVEFISGVGAERSESDGDVEDHPVEESVAVDAIGAPMTVLDLPQPSGSSQRTLASVVPSHGLRTASGVTGYAMEGTSAPSLAEDQTTVVAGADRPAGNTRTDSAGTTDRDHALRQRLRSAMGSVGG